MVTMTMSLFIAHRSKPILALIWYCDHLYMEWFVPKLLYATSICFWCVFVAIENKRWVETWWRRSVLRVAKLWRCLAQPEWCARCVVRNVSSLVIKSLLVSLYREISSMLYGLGSARPRQLLPSKNAAFPHPFQNAGIWVEETGSFRLQSTLWEGKQTRHISVFRIPTAFIGSSRDGMVYLQAREMVMRFCSFCIA